MKNQKPWFGKKWIGWGWGMPQTWQGWVLFALFIISILIISSLAKYNINLFFALLILVVFIFISIIWISSGPPDWGTYWKKKK